jgi:UPF0716 family protein affecting phage T7 exclusion
MVWVFLGVGILIVFVIGAAVLGAILARIVPRFS